MSTRTHRHVVLEGPDGAGKSTLARYLTAVVDTPLAPKMSDSLKGVAHLKLADLVDRDMSRWMNLRSHEPAVNRSAFSGFTEYSPSMIYDRYPLISEPIYGHEVRRNVQPEFLTPWYASRWHSFLAFDPLVIFCLPPYKEVAGNVSPERDMPGVWRSIHRLYEAYSIEALKFPGTKIVYDYTVQKPGDLVDPIARHLGF